MVHSGSPWTLYSTLYFVLVGFGWPAGDAGPFGLIVPETVTPVALRLEGGSTLTVGALPVSARMKEKAPKP